MKKRLIHSVFPQAKIYEARECHVNQISIDSRTISSLLLRMDRFHTTLAYTDLKRCLYHKQSHSVDTHTDCYVSTITAHIIRIVSCDYASKTTSFCSICHHIQATFYNHSISPFFDLSKPFIKRPFAKSRLVVLNAFNVINSLSYMSKFVLLPCQKVTLKLDGENLVSILSIFNSHLIPNGLRKMMRFYINTLLNCR